MSHFLLIYDRDTGQLVRKKRFRSSANAMHARFRAEQEFRGCDEIEIVALAAESEQALMRTHGRYFLNLRELADRLA